MSKPLATLMLLALPVVTAATDAAAKQEEAQDRWSKTTFSMSIGARPTLPPGLVRAALVEAAGTWNAVGTGPEVTVAEGRSRHDQIAADGVNNVVFVTSGWPGAPSQLALTYAYADVRTGTIVEADIALNAQHHLFSVDPEADSAYDLVGLLTHELGHVLGLDHLEEQEHAVMFPGTPRGRMAQRVLTPDDEEALLSLYEGALVHASGCSAAGAAPSLPFALLGALLLMCRVEGRRRAGVRPA